MKLLIFSDIHCDKSSLARLMAQEADYYFVAGDLANWSRGLDELGPIMQPCADRVYVMPGNHESAADIARFCVEFGFHDFHCRTIQVGAYHIVGLGYSNLTPFKTPGEYSEEQLAARLEPFAGLSPMVLICHCPPKNSTLDGAGHGQHYGSTALRAFIEAQQPEYFYCGHIHEAAGKMDRFGRTIGYNAGKKGCLLELG